jgi:hypothetical protein
VERFQKKPLIWPILWKTAIYFFAALVFQYGEKLFRLLLEHEPLATAGHSALRYMARPQFWSTQILVVMLFFVLIGTRELIRTLGQAEFLSLVFGMKRAVKTKAEDSKAR